MCFGLGTAVRPRADKRGSRETRPLLKTRNGELVSPLARERWEHVTDTAWDIAARVPQAENLNGHSAVLNWCRGLPTGFELRWQLKNRRHAGLRW